MSEFSLHLWVIFAAILCGASCALLGIFLVLRKMSLVGDAISHSILPGLALAFILTGTRDPIPMFIGAAISGLIAAGISEFLSSRAKVDQGAALGIVFTSLFALGVLLIRQAADKVDLDPGCVLYGLIEYLPLETITIGEFEIPRGIIVLAAVALVNLLCISLFYKELVVSSFDEGLAETMGLRPSLIRYLLMTLVAITCIAAFEVAGSILVVALLIIPASTARFFCERLISTILVAQVFNIIGCVAGYFLALRYDTSVAGAIGFSLGLLFLTSVVLAPKHGFLGQAFAQLRLALRIMKEDILGLLFRVGERSAPALSEAMIIAAAGGGLLPIIAMRKLRIEGLIQRNDYDRYVLSSAGAERAKSLVRTHRLWERFLVDELQLKPDHVHETAMKLEHFTSPALADQLAEEVKPVERDPHGKEIPE